MKDEEPGLDRHFETPAKDCDRQPYCSTTLLRQREWLDGCRAARRLGEPLSFSSRSTADLMSRTRKLADRYRRRGWLSRADCFSMAISVGELCRRGVLAREYRP